MNLIAGWAIAVALSVELKQIAKAIDTHQCGPERAAQEAAHGDDAARKQGVNHD